MALPQMDAKNTSILTLSKNSENVRIVRSLSVYTGSSVASWLAV